MAARFAVVATMTGCAFLALLLSQSAAGSVSVLCSNNSESCHAVARAYEASTGESVDLVRLPTSEALNRLDATQATPEFDVWLGGPAEAYISASQQGLLDKLENSIALQSIPAQLRDAQSFWAGVYGGILAFCVSDGLSPDELPQRWDDLLNPRLQGRIVAPSPILSGTAATMLWVQYARFGSVDQAMTYMAELDGQLVTYTDSGTTPARLVAVGKAAVGVSFVPYCLAQQAAGAAVHAVYPLDGTGFEVGGVAVVADAPNSEAAQDFAEFAMSESGQLAGTVESMQLPTSSNLSGNLLESLEGLTVPILSGDVDEASRMRPVLISQWASRVRNGTY